MAENLGMVRNELAKEKGGSRAADEPNQTGAPCSPSMEGGALMLLIYKSRARDR